MAFLRSGHPVDYVQIKARKRVGKSKINLLRDGLRFLVIIMRVATLLFSDAAVFAFGRCYFFSLGLGRYIYHYIQTNQFLQHGRSLVS